MRNSYSKPRTKDNILEDVEIDKIKSVAKNASERFLVWTLLYTGMRISELIHMRDDWIDWNKNLIRIPKSQPCECMECKIKKGGVWRPKNPQSARAIPIVPELRQILQDFFCQYTSVMSVIHDRVAAHGIIRALGKRAKIRHKAFPHALRGTFATVLAAKDFTIPEISEALGWTSWKTAEIYVRLSAARVQKAFKEKW